MSKKRRRRKRNRRSPLKGLALIGLGLGAAVGAAVLKNNEK